MVDGEMIWRPTCITSITKTDEGKTALVVADLTSEAGTYKNDHFMMSSMDPSYYYSTHPYAKREKLMNSIVALYYSGVW